MRDPTPTPQRPLLSSQLPKHGHRDREAGTQGSSLPSQLGLQLTFLLKSSLTVSYFIFPPQHSSPPDRCFLCLLVFYFSLSHENISSVDSCLFCPLLDPQGLALSGRLMNVSLMNGAPSLSFFILIISLFWPETGLRNGASLASSISSNSLRRLCGPKSGWWTGSSHVCPSSSKSSCIAGLSSPGFAEAGEMPPSPEPGLVWKRSGREGTWVLVHGDLCSSSSSTQHLLLAINFVLVGHLSSTLLANFSCAIQRCQLQSPCYTLDSQDLIHLIAESLYPLPPLPISQPPTPATTFLLSVLINLTFF